MKTDFIVALTFATILGTCWVGYGAEVGTMTAKGFALAGLGDTADQDGTDYPDFVMKGADNRSYLIFGGDYDANDWQAWVDDVYYLSFAYSTLTDGKWLGFAVGAAGDVTGDGDSHRDVLIGDINYLDVNNPANSQGKAWLVHGISYTTDRPTITLSAGGGGLNSELTEISSSQAQNWFGCSMGSAGNLDEADYDDFIIGASLWDDTGEVDVGRAYVFLGDDEMPSTLTTSANGIAFTGENEYDHFGCSVVGMDGLNSGDDAVAVGASWYDTRSEGSIVKNNCGRVYIFYSDGSLSATSAASADIKITGADDDNFFGCALATGDFVGDVSGYDDLAVGARVL